MQQLMMDFSDFSHYFITGISVFMYCYEGSFKLEPVWRKEHARIERYTRMALLLNPNVATFWNQRKRLISHQFLDGDCDLLLTRLVLSQKPKCVEALAHRRWLLQKQAAVNLLQPGWMEIELDLCTLLANRSKCNYHAWSHRQWIFSLDRSASFDVSVWISEFRINDEFARFHLSDHSGWHYRKFLLDQLKRNVHSLEKEGDELISKLLPADVARQNGQFYLYLLLDELVKNGDLLISYSAHESLWYYRRFLLQALSVVQHSCRSSESVFLDKCKGQLAACPAQTMYLENHLRWLSSPSVQIL